MQRDLSASDGVGAVATGRRRALSSPYARPPLRYPHRRARRDRPGSLRGMMLADHGATVIRVEREDRPPVVPPEYDLLGRSRAATVRLGRSSGGSASRGGRARPRHLTRSQWPRPGSGWNDVGDEFAIIFAHRVVGLRNPVVVAVGTRFERASPARPVSCNRRATRRPPAAESHLQSAQSSPGLSFTSFALSSAVSLQKRHHAEPDIRSRGWPQVIALRLCQRFFQAGFSHCRSRA